MTNLLNPSFDFVFKNIFGVEKHKKVLICLLNSILNGKPLIKTITLLNNEHKKDRLTGRSVMLDIKAVTDNDTIVNIEIQSSRDGNLANRAYYYQSRMMKEELNESETFDTLPDLISIWFTDYNETARLHHTNEIVPMYKKTPLDEIEVASEKTRIFIIELPKIDVKKASLKNIFSVWMYFLKDPELIPEEFVQNVPEVHEALNELKHLSQDEDFRNQYQAELKHKNDMTSRLSNAKAEGIVEGKRETALNAIDMGLSTEQIAKLTGLSEEEIRGLK